MDVLTSVVSRQKLHSATHTWTISDFLKYVE